MGYGLNRHGSGVAASLYLAKQGAKVTITDLRTAEQLAKTLPLLDSYPVQWQLGYHVETAFKEADLIVKNPGVRRDSSYLQHGKPILTDISLFLEQNRNPLVAVTGSKGKSSVVSALHYALSKDEPSYLGGNITVSPLSFLVKLNGSEPVVLELSSWQLGDLLLTNQPKVKAKLAILTNLMPDHQNYYHNDMQAYAEDKAQIFSGQNKDDYAILNYNDEWTPFFKDKISGRLAYVSLSKPKDNLDNILYADGNEWVLNHNGYEERVAKPNPTTAILPINLMIAALALVLYKGYSLTEALTKLKDFGGVPHRCEFIKEIKGVKYYNDSAATIPQATLASAGNFEAAKLHLILGGSDKELDFTSLMPLLKEVKGLYLLAGNATDKLILLLNKSGLSYNVFNNMAAAVMAARGAAISGDSVLLSPAATSFGMFANEFARGEAFVEAMEGIN